MLLYLTKESHHPTCWDNSCPSCPEMSCCAAWLLPPGNSFCEQCTSLHCWYPLNTHYCAFTAGSSKSIKATCQKPPLVWMQKTILKILAKQMQFWDEGLWNHCSSVTTEWHHFRMPHLRAGKTLFFVVVAVVVQVPWRNTLIMLPERWQWTRIQLWLTKWS